MPKQQQVIRNSRGLYNQFNPQGEVPEGALAEAENCVINREGVTSKRRGFDTHGDNLSAAPSALMEYLDRVLALVGTTINYDSDGEGTWAAWSGSFEKPSNAVKMRGHQARLNFYFTTSEGVYRTDSLTTSPVKAGVPQAINLEPTLTGTGGDWFIPNSRVAYKVLFGREDANDFLLLGAPSFRRQVVNTRTRVTATISTTTVTVTHVGHGFTTGDTVEVEDVENAGAYYAPGRHSITVTGSDTYTYGVTVSAPSNIPSSRMYVGKKYQVSLSFPIPDGIVAGDFFEVHRTQLSADSGSDPGDRYFRVQRREVTAAEVTAGSITYLDKKDEALLEDVELYTNVTQESESQENSTPPHSLDIDTYKGHTFYSNIRRKHAIDILLDDIGEINNGQIIRLTDGSTNLDYKAADAYDLGELEYQNFTTEVTSSQNNEQTARSLVRLINADPSNTLCYAFYTSGPEDRPGKIRIVRRDFSTTPITFEAVSSGAGDAWSPNPEEETAVSTQDVFKNGLAFSKFEQPDAVPLLNFEFVGSEESPIERVLALRDSLIILKEEGVWRLSGEQDINFVVKALDPSVRCIAPETAVVLNNSVYCWSNLGVVKINESGVAVVSRPIENVIKKAAQGSTFRQLAHAAAYEEQTQYLVWYPEAGGGSQADVAHVYNYLNRDRPWTKWRKRSAGALALNDSDRLFLAHPEEKYVLRERKSFSSDGEDFKEESVTVSIDEIHSLTDIEVTWDHSDPLVKGAVLEQSGNSSIITQVESLGGDSYRLTLRESMLASLGSGVICLGVDAFFQPVAEAGGNTGVSKQFSQVQFYLEDLTAPNSEIQIYSDRVEAPQTLTYSLPTSTAVTTPFRVKIPQSFQRCRALSVRFRNFEAREFFDVFQTVYSFRGYSDRTTRAT